MLFVIGVVVGACWVHISVQRTCSALGNCHSARALFGDDLSTRETCPVNPTGSRWSSLFCANYPPNWWATWQQTRLWSCIAACRHIRVHEMIPIIMAPSTWPFFRNGWRGGCRENGNTHGSAIWYGPVIYFTLESHDFGWINGLRSLLPYTCRYLNLFNSIFTALVSLVLLHPPIADDVVVVVICFFHSGEKLHSGSFICESNLVHTHTHTHVFFGCWLDG